MFLDVIYIAAILLVAGLTIYAAIEARSVQVTRREIWTPRLPAAFDGFTIMHISDLHLRGGKSFATIVEEAIRGVEADMVAITGDVAYSRKGLPRFESILSTLREFSSNAPILACTGNGEIIYRRVGEGTQAAVEQAGGKMLRNENAQVDRGNGNCIYILGVDDPFTKSDDLNRALSCVPEEAL